MKCPYKSAYEKAREILIQREKELYEDLKNLEESSTDFDSANIWIARARWGAVYDIILSLGI